MDDKNKNNFHDKIIVCQTCEQKFPWTAGEQKFYAEKGLQPPRHCRVCRAALKEAEKDKFRGNLEIINKGEDE
jgi:hypothetical protein